MGKIRINSGEKELRDSIVDADHEHAIIRMKESSDKETEFKNTYSSKAIKNNSRQYLSSVKKLIQIVGFIIFLIFIIIPFVIIANLIEYMNSRNEGRIFRFVPPLVGPAYMVDTIGSLKIFIYTNDHPPPHFHVVTDKYNAKFDIENCNLLGSKGSFVNRHSKQIQSWHRSNIDVLKGAWEKTRPTPV